MIQRFVGGNIYEFYDPVTHKLSGYMRSINAPIDLDVTLLHTEQLTNGTNHIWQLNLGGGVAPVYVHSGNKSDGAQTTASGSGLTDTPSPLNLPKWLEDLINKFWWLKWALLAFLLLWLQKPRKK